MIDEKVTNLWEDYQNGLMYQSSSGLTKNLPTFVNFFEGKQWANPTKNTKNMPRPVVNIIKLICRNKKSSILSTPVKIVYHAENHMSDVAKFNNFAEFIQKEIGQEGLDKKALDDGIKKGSYFYHYYWDSEARGKDGSKNGGLRCETIDPLNIFFSNPTEKDEQKQKWILIATREDVESVRAKCDRSVDKDTITSDETESKYGTIEQEGNKLCTVLTKYFRKNGEVHCEKATKSVVINKAFSISPDLQRAGVELGIDEDAPNNSLPDGGDTKPLMSGREGAYLYPIVVGNYEIRENSIYGLGEIEGLIPNQKAINFNLAMSLLNAQEIAWGKYIVLPNALEGQTINNEPGQVLTDHSNTGHGIRKMTEQNIQSQPLQIVETLTQLTRTVTGASEVMTGEIVGSNMSGAAIAQLQSQASLPIEELKNTFWIVKEKQGKILAQFFKLFYYQKEFTYNNEAENNQMAESKVSDIFSSEDYNGIEFSIVVEATAGTKASAAGDINALDMLLEKNQIDIVTYLKAYPKDALSNRSELIKGVQEAQNNKLAQMQQKIDEYEQKLMQYTGLLQQQQQTVDSVISVINENNKLKAYIANLYAEAKAKIEQGNEVIMRGNQELQTTTNEATALAGMVANQVS